VRWVWTNEDDGVVRHNLEVDLPRRRTGQKHEFDDDPSTFRAFVFLLFFFFFFFLRRPLVLINYLAVGLISSY
jgi:hypothetical protein